MSGGEVLLHAYENMKQRDLEKYRLDTLREQVRNNFNLGLKRIGIEQQNADTNRMAVQNTYEIGMYNAGSNRIQADSIARRNAQLNENNRLANAWNGYTNQDIMQQHQEMLNQQLAQGVIEAQTQTKALAAAKNVQDMTEAVKALANADVDKANVIVKNNPLLQDAIRQNWGVTSIQPVDWNNPEDIQGLKRLGVNTDALSDEQKQAMSHLIFKTYDADGNVNFHSVSDLIKEANLLKNMSASDANNLTTTINKYKQIASGTTNAPEYSEQQIKGISQEIAQRVAPNDPKKQEDIYNSLLDEYTTGTVNSPEGLVNSVAMDDKTRESLLQEVRSNEFGSNVDTKKQADTAKALMQAKEASLDVALKQMKLQKAVKQEQALELYNKYSSKLLNDKRIWSAPVKDETVYKILLAKEKDNGVHAATNKQFNDFIKRIRLYREMRKDLGVLSTTLKDKNFWSNISRHFRAYFGGDKKALEELKNYQGAHQRAMNLVLNYVNALSGQAFTDEQVRKIKDVVGYDEWKDGKVNIDSFRNFTNAVREVVDEESNTLKPLFPASTYEQMTALNKFDEGKHLSQGTIREAVKSLEKGVSNTSSQGQEPMPKGTNTANSTNTDNTNKSKTKSINVADFVTD